MTDKIDTHAKAVAHFEKVKPFRGRPDEPKPVEFTAGYGSRVRRTSDKTMRREADGSVVFTLYRTDVVTHHPDGSITIQGYPSQTTSRFAWGLLPNSITLHTVGELWFTGDGDDFWGPLPLKEGQAYPKYGCNKTTQVIMLNFGSVTLAPDKRGWSVRSLEDHIPFEVPVIDKARAREVSRKYSLADFKTWFRAVNALDGDLASRWEREDPEAALDALEERDFDRAFRFVEKNEPNSFQRWDQQEDFTENCVEKLRVHAYNAGGVVSHKTRDILPRNEYSTWKTNRRKYG